MSAPAVPPPPLPSLSGADAAAAMAAAAVTGEERQVFTKLEALKQIR